MTEQDTSRPSLDHRISNILTTAFSHACLKAGLVIKLGTYDPLTSR